MTYFAFTPPSLKEMKLKIAIVFLHEECRFELWLAASNRKVRSGYIEFLSTKDLGRYTLSQARPERDSIIASIIVEQPDFDNPEKLKGQIEAGIIGFAADMMFILKADYKGSGWK